MNDQYVLICILVSVAATLFMRALTFYIIGKRKKKTQKKRYNRRKHTAPIKAVLIV